MALEKGEAHDRATISSPARIGPAHIGMAHIGMAHIGMAHIDVDEPLAPIV